jgi:hypothetical protein
VQRAPGLPCALCFSEERKTATPRALSVPREDLACLKNESATISVIASEATQSISPLAEAWIASSQSLSSGAHSRDQ